MLQAQPMDRRLLGDWAALAASGAGVGGRGRLGRLLPGRRTTETAGEALVGHLLHRATANGVEVWLDAPVVDLLGDGDGVTGVVVRRDGADVAVTAGTRAAGQRRLRAQPGAARGVPAAADRGRLVDVRRAPTPATC